MSAGLGNITAYDAETVAGFGRIVGDGAIYFYIQDLIVDERYQGQGLGARLLTDLIAQVKMMAAPQASIGLMSVAGKEKFYEKFGFVNRPVENFGAGMTLSIKDM